MKLLILGGTGATGKHLLEKALAQNHQVTAMVRDPSQVKLTDAHLTLVQGQATRAADVEKALAGQEAVLSALGPRVGADPVCAEAAAAVVEAMKKTGVTRLVWLSAGGVGDSAPQLIAASFVFGRIIMPLFLKKPYANHGRAEETLRASGLEWTVIRPVQLVDAPTGGKPSAVAIGPTAPQNLKIARADVAQFMLDELTARSWVRQMPILQG
jgi:putative NADH-flavin reductase